MFSPLQAHQTKPKPARNKSAHLSHERLLEAVRVSHSNEHVGTSIRHASFSLRHRGVCWERRIRVLAVPCRLSALCDDASSRSRTGRKEVRQPATSLVQATTLADDAPASLQLPSLIDDGSGSPEAAFADDIDRRVGHVSDARRLPRPMTTDGVHRLRNGRRPYAHLRMCQRKPRVTHGATPSTEARLPHRLGAVKSASEMRCTSAPPPDLSLSGFVGEARTAALPSRRSPRRPPKPCSRPCRHRLAHSLALR